MYGKKRIVIERKRHDRQLVYCRGTIEDDRPGGSSQRLGFVEQTDFGYRVYFCNGKKIADVKTQKEAKVAIFNAAKDSDEFSVCDGCKIDSDGVISEKEEEVTL
jgi:hypothetical protein